MDLKKLFIFANVYILVRTLYIWRWQGKAAYYCKSILPPSPPPTPRQCLWRYFTKGCFPCQRKAELTQSVSPYLPISMIRGHVQNDDVTAKYCTLYNARNVVYSEFSKCVNEGSVY